MPGTWSTRCLLAAFALAFAFAFAAAGAAAGDSATAPPAPLVAAMDAARPPPPGAGCMDARRMQRAAQTGPRALALQLDDGVHYDILLGEDCPAVVAPGGALELLAPHGWACSGGPSLVRAADGRTCAVATVGVVDGREIAARARATAQAAGGAAEAPAPVAGAPPSTTLDTVEVRGRRARGFRGTTDYCVASRHVRSWSEDTQGLVVDVPPARAGGHRRYRIETNGSCPLLWRAEGIALRSGRGTGVVCGFPGDQVVAASPASGERGPGIFFKPCPIIAVYPLPAGE